MGGEGLHVNLSGRSGRSHSRDMKTTIMANIVQATTNNPPNMASSSSNDALITSTDPLHPANHICSLCYQFYGHGWVTGTGGGISIKQDKHVYLAPSGVQKELMKPTDIFVMDYDTKEYIRRPQVIIS